MIVVIVFLDFVEFLSVLGSGVKEIEFVNEEVVGMIVFMGFI